MYLTIPKDETYAQAFIREMHNDLDDVKRSFIKIGFRLVEANENEYYKELGYQNIVELAEAEFGFKSSTTYEFMKVYELAHDPDCRWHIAQEYDKYSYSQLLALTYLKYSAKNARLLVRPTDSVRNIKKFVSVWNEEAKHWNYYDVYPIETVDAYLKAYDHLKANDAKHAEEPKQVSEYAGQLSGPEEEFSERSENSEFKPEVQKETVEPMTDSELTKYCLRLGSWTEEGKFRIVRCHSELMRSAFVKFVKEEYGVGGRMVSGVPYKSIESGGKGYTICRLNGGKIVLAWAVVAGYISRMIEADEYLTDKEKEQYVKWQAKYNGFAVSLPTKQEQPEPEEKFSERSENSIKEIPITNMAYLRTVCCNDFAKIVSKCICEMPDTFGESMPYEERVCKWLSIWLTLAPPKNNGGVP